MTTDPFDDLKRAFERETPEPDAERRKANLARAGEMFDTARDAGAESRHAHERLDTGAAFPKGARTMLKSLVSRPVLAAAGAIAAVGLAVVLTMPGRDSSQATSPGSGPDPVVDMPAPAPTLPPGERGPDRPVQVANVPAVEAEPEAPAPASSSASPPAPIAAGSGSETGSEAQPVLVASSEPAPTPPVQGLRAGSRPRSANSEAVEFNDAAIAELSRALEPLGKKLGGSPDKAALPAAPAESLVAATEERLVDRLNVAKAGVRARGRRHDRAVHLPRDQVDYFRVAPAPAEALGLRGDPDAPRPRPADAEDFANEDASPVRVVAEEPVSTFSVDVDTASYSVVRTWLNEWGELPDPDAVRIEELVNYFPYAYEPPGERGGPFRPTVTVSETPWNPDTLLMHIGIQGRQPETDDRPPLNLVFLLDTSGSMDDPKKLPLLVQSFRLMLGQLDEADEVAIVTYADSARRVLDATPATDRGAILAALEQLHAGGSTAGAEGIQLACATAEGMAAEGEVSRVILATDGDFNVGIHDPEELEAFIARKRDGGVYLSVLGFGRDNFDDATMQALAQNGNGQAAYIDTLAEAQKVLVDQLVGTLFPIANDVKIQVEFNPAAVAEYRLIGYETRALRREDFSNDRVDAGEIGAGHAVTALYEVTPVGSPAVLHEPLRYASRPAEPPVAAESRAAADELAFLRIRYKEPGVAASELIERPVRRDAGAGGEDQRFAAAIAGFGQLLRDGAYLGDWSWADAIALAEANAGGDRFGYRREAVTLMRLAESLAESQ